MVFSPSELAFIGNNKEIIKKILQKKYEDIIQSLLLESDATKTEVLKLWAKECLELTIALDNIGKAKPKQDIPHTGI